MSNLQYLLHVNIKQYPGETAGSFEAAVIDFMNAGGFARLAGGPSLAALELLRVVSFRDREPAGQYPDHVNLWQVPVASLALANLMNRSRDDRQYKAADRFIQQEQQHFVFYDALRDFNSSDPRSIASHLPSRDAQSRATATSASVGGTRLLRVVHEFSRSTRSLKSIRSSDYGMYSALAVLLVTYMQLAGWKSRGLYWSVTGQLDTFMEFWEVDSGLEGHWTVAELKDKWIETLATTYPKNASISLIDYCRNIPSSFTLLERFAKRKNPDGPDEGNWEPC